GPEPAATLMLLPADSLMNPLAGTVETAPRTMAPVACTSTLGDAELPPPVVAVTLPPLMLPVSTSRAGLPLTLAGCGGPVVGRRPPWMSTRPPATMLALGLPLSVTLRSERTVRAPVMLTLLIVTSSVPTLSVLSSVTLPPVRLPTLMLPVWVY